MSADRPRFGEPRVVTDEWPTVYPGEQASAHVPAHVIKDGLHRAATTGAPARVPLRKWLVEPAPGWRMAWLRWRYRLVGQWLERMAESVRP